jgi:hypothetical protein
LELDQASVIRVREGRRDIVAKSKSSNCVTDNVLLLSLILALALLQDAVVALDLIDACFASHNVRHWPVCTRTVSFDKVLDLLDAVHVKLSILARKLLEDHVVLGQRSCLICEQELDAAQLFRDC